jgi:hypothetical protein
MNDRLSEERIEQIRARLRRTMLCPYAPVKGGRHRQIVAGPRLVMCSACGLITQSDPTMGDLADLLAEVDQLRSADEEREAAEQRLSDLRDEHQRQAAAWDKQRERLTAGGDRLRTELAAALDLDSDAAWPDLIREAAYHRAARDQLQHRVDELVEQRDQALYDLATGDYGEPVETTDPDETAVAP